MAENGPRYVADVLPENPSTKDKMTSYIRIVYHVDNLNSVRGGGDILEKEDEVATLLEYYLFGSVVSCRRYFVFLPQDLARRYIGAHLAFVREMLQNRELKLEGLLRTEPDEGWEGDLEAAVDQVRSEFPDLKPTTITRARSRIQYLVRDPPYFLDPAPQGH